MAAWEDWVQDVGKSIVDGAVEYKIKQPYELQKLRIEALGSNGEIYTEGQPAKTVAASGLGGLGIPTGVLLLGGLVLAVVLLKD